MDKKGEIDHLSKIIEPDISVITNINYAHAKNFRTIKHIALAKAEIIKNTRSNGFIVLNADDSFFKFHKKIALSKNLNVISFGVKNKKSDFKLIKEEKYGKYFKINIKVNKFKKNFLISNNYQSNIYNILAALAVMSIYINILKLDKKIFLRFEIPRGRGDFSKIKIKKKTINLIDESYNSNPLSLKSAILNYDKIDTKNSKKYLLLGDMLELGSHSRKLHESIAPIINKSKVDKVFVKGNNAKFIFKNLLKSKKGKILRNNSQIFGLIRNDLNNNDYLMVKASNATGFNKIVNDLRGFN
jgi:murE/murF fusion protein